MTAEMVPQSNHTFESPACAHDMHEHCVIVCPYCTSVCSCECHTGQEIGR